MKKSIFTLCTLFFLTISLFSHATTLIVDSHYPRPAGVYSTIQLAYNAASPGDTILISPAEGEYAGITITKKIHIVGTGWARPSSGVPNTKTSGFTFNAGAQGSSVSGLEVNGMFNIQTDSITVKRNKLQYIYVGINSTNIVIIQNYIISARNCCSWQDGTILSIWENTEVFISNNILIHTGTWEPHAIRSMYPSNLIICNNILKANSYAIRLDISGGNYSTHSVYNNIVLGGSISGISTPNNFNNIGNTTQFPAENSNQQNVVMTNVFVDATNYDFHLKELSPAIGAGVGGTDCGIYGGTFPFVDNGRTWLPIITEMNVPDVVNVKDGLDVSVKAKSGK